MFDVIVSLLSIFGKTAITSKSAIKFSSANRSIPRSDPIDSGDGHASHPLANPDHQPEAEPSSIRCESYQNDIEATHTQHE